MDIVTSNLRALRRVPRVGRAPLAEAELSLRRSRVRTRVLLMLASLRESPPRALAQACGLDPSRLRWAMRGRAPYYREGLSLVALGLAEELATPAGRMYVVPERGRRKARQITSRVARRAAARAAVQ